MNFFAWLESLRISTWIRESDSVFAYSGVLFMHTLGLGMLVGTNILLDLSILRRRPDLPVHGLDAFYPIMFGGLWINAASGTLLLIADATTKLTNPVFYIKMACVALAVVNMVVIRRRIARFSPTGVTDPRIRSLAMLSLVFWFAAIAAGRLMAYLGPVSGAPGLSG
jgi:hypothetical protein